MSLLMFEGPAGTGKTTRLLAAARDHLDQHPLDSEQRVLALTKYHGSRRRMDLKLRDPDDGVGNALDCVTIDSFAWNLVGCWRSLVEHLGLEPVEGDFSSMTTAAGTLLQKSDVAKWVARRYPVVVVDEMQDCKGGEVQMLRGLSSVATCLTAADEFQDLQASDRNEAVEWAHSAGEVRSLHRVHRTSTSGLLGAASAIVAAEPLKDGPGFRVLQARNYHVGASFLARNLTWWSGQVAVISPAGPRGSTFVRRLFDRLAEKPFKYPKKKAAGGPGKYGPFNVSWELSHSQQETAVLSALAEVADGKQVHAASLVALAQTQLPALIGWLDHQRRVLGRTTFPLDEVAAAAKRLLARRRAYARSRPYRYRAMTVEQAKNREFEYVVVLWPVELGGGGEVHRRKLYNAITRAKEQAVVVVQDPSNDRLGKPPFVGGKMP